MSLGVRHARYRAPATSGARLIIPPADEWGALVEQAPRRRAAATLSIADRPWADWARQSRAEILSLAAQYTASFGGEFDGSIDVDRPVIVTGHQPELMHPGVWLKNFAAARAAQEAGGVALNLVIDGDRCKRTSVNVPGGAVDDPRVTAVEFDVPVEAVPWEERRVVDDQRWRSFADRILVAGGELLDRPMIQEWWPLAIERTAATGRMGLGFAQARRLAEQQWGVRTLELPQSALCETTAFRQFVAVVLGDLPRFAEAYNGSLGEYRRLHGLRNAAQPAPDLARVGPWRQAPFWLWTADDPQRRALHARPADGEPGVVLVADLHGFERRLDCRGDASAAVEELAAWTAAGMKLRSRALTTTMFARLAVADLFIHGIGGAKYDEATDAIIARFFGVEAPPFAVLSGTLHLPAAALAAAEGEPAGALRHARRELAFHPERALTQRNGRAAEALDEPARQALAAKARWIATEKNPANAAVRHREIAAANGVLYQRALDAGRKLDERLAQTIAADRARRILAGREYAACLFSRESLARFLLDFLRSAP